MEELDSFLARARSIVAGGRALTWSARGLAAAGTLALGVELLFRAYPVDPAWPVLAGCLAFGGVLAAGGWARAWPSQMEVARLADLRLGARERLSTALEFAPAAGVLVGRQRSDAAGWLAGADPKLVRDPGLPRRSAALGLVAGLFALGLAFAPNPALQQLRSERAQQAAQNAAADKIDAIVKQVQSSPGALTDEQKQALIQDLKQAEQNVRNAKDKQSAIAAISQAQSDISKLQDPTLPSKNAASAAAGKELQGNPNSVKAGQALAQGNNAAGAAELQKLGSNVSKLSPQEQQQLAQSLSNAAQASKDGNPDLSKSLQQASDALQKGDAAGAQQALNAAFQQLQQQAGADDFTGASAQAVNGLQQAKQGLAQDQPGQGSAGQGGQGSGQGAGQGQGGQGKGSGQGAGSGSGSGTGTGSSGSGSGTGTGGGSGSGSSPGGTKPAGTSEKVYVPGADTTPTGNGLPTGDPTSGSDAGLTPYQDVLGTYQRYETSEVDRQLIPEQERDLVRAYFQNLSQPGP